MTEKQPKTRRSEGQRPKKLFYDQDEGQRGFPKVEEPPRVERLMDRQVDNMSNEMFRRTNTSLLFVPFANVCDLRVR